MTQPEISIIYKRCKPQNKITPSKSRDKSIVSTYRRAFRLPVTLRNAELLLPRIFLLPCLFTRHWYSPRSSSFVFVILKVPSALILKRDDESVFKFARSFCHLYSKGLLSNDAEHLNNTVEPFSTVSFFGCVIHLKVDCE